MYFLTLTSFDWDNWKLIFLFLAQRVALSFASIFILIIIIIAKCLFACRLRKTVWLKTNSFADFIKNSHKHFADLHVTLLSSNFFLFLSFLSDIASYLYVFTPLATTLNLCMFIIHTTRRVIGKFHEGGGSQSGTKTGISREMGSEMV